MTKLSAFGAIAVALAAGCHERRDPPRTSDASAAGTRASHGEGARDANAAADGGARHARVPDADAGKQGLLCVPPRTSGFPRCAKGVATSEAALKDCLAKSEAASKKTPRFRVGGGAWIPLSRSRHRCVPVPLDTKVHVALDDVAGLDVTVASDCASRALDVQGPNGYLAYWTRCSTRDRARDEIVPPR